MKMHSQDVEKDDGKVRFPWEGEVEKDGVDLTKENKPKEKDQLTNSSPASATEAFPDIRQPQDSEQAETKPNIRMSLKFDGQVKVEPRGSGQQIEETKGATDANFQSS